MAATNVVPPTPPAGALALEVPWHEQTSRLNCGPTAVMMALGFFGTRPPLAAVERAVRVNVTGHHRTARVHALRSSYFGSPGCSLRAIAPDH